jgi:periplasmic protein TonB
MKSTLGRSALAIGLAVCIAGALFWLMNYLILSAERGLEEVESFRTVDFVRVQQEERLETRERSRPEPPQPEEPPPPPPQLMARSAQADAVTSDFGMPNVAIPTNITGGPFLAENAELIPVVRLAPQYPRQAARAGISGWVRLRIVVNPDGSVREARAIEAEPRGLFEAAAVTAAMRGRFRPRMVDGAAVEATGEYTVTFSLGGQ